MRCAHAVLLSLLVSPAVASSAQGTAPEILTQLKDKPLFLRGCWRSDKLEFAHDGTPAQQFAPQSFTLSGIDVDQADFRGDSLEIQGHRVGIEFDKSGTPHRVRLKWRHYSGKMTLRIAGQPGDDFGPALEAIFAPDLKTLIPSQQAYWEAAGKGFVPDALDHPAGQEEQSAELDTKGPFPAGDAPTSTAKLENIGGTVKPPVLVRQKDPSYSDAARGMGYSANVEIYLRVDPAGRPSHLKVIRPAGLGLDENALAAVSAYRFKPATREGVPVKVNLYVDVNFQIF